MADSRKNNNRSVLLSPKFFLLCLVYVAAYVALRYYGELVFQQVAVPGPNGGVQVYRMASANPTLPHWRQQLWRAVFSAAMVVEEEGDPLFSPLREKYGQSQARAGGRGDGQRYVTRAAEDGRALAPAQPQRQYGIQSEPQFAQSRPPATARTPQATGRGNPYGLDEGEQMIFDPRAAGR